MAKQSLWSRFLAMVGLAPARKNPSRRPRLGSGKRFAELEHELAARGAYDPKALAAWIGRRRYGKSRMAKLARSGRRRARR